MEHFLRTWTQVAIWLALSHQFIPVDSIPPTGILELRVPENNTTHFMFCSTNSVAGWGPKLPAAKTLLGELHTLSSNSSAIGSDGCSPYKLPTTIDRLPVVIMVDRGKCSFIKKMKFAQESGAKAVIIRETRRAIYEAIDEDRIHHNDTNRPHFDYDCSRGQSFVESVKRPVWETDDTSCSGNPACLSNTCMPTGKIYDVKGLPQRHQLCCAWDTFIIMGANLTAAKEINIPAIYVTIAEGNRLANLTSNHVYLMRKTEETFDLSSTLLWLLGVSTAILAAYYSASPSREAYYRLSKECNQTYSPLKMVGVENVENRQLDWADDFEGNEVSEISTRQAILYIIFAGACLLLMFYVKLVKVFPVLFLLAGAKSSASVVFKPICSTFASRFELCKFRSLFSCGLASDPAKTTSVVALAGSIILACIWYFYRTRCWYLQDYFGISLCCTFLRSIQLPNLRVATIFLSLAFFYDIFFVFISPYVFGSNVMVEVASGGPAASTRRDYPGIDFCERYPLYASCMDPEPLPMLLILPRSWTWLSGYSMLGLGDIILPGLLISLALRFDLYLDKKHYLLHDTRKQNTACSTGYTALDPLMQKYESKRCLRYYTSSSVAYALGLGMANVAVNVTRMGQPALMYLVPCTLGTLIIHAWIQGDLHALWHGYICEHKDPNAHDTFAFVNSGKNHRRDCGEDEVPLLRSYSDQSVV